MSENKNVLSRREIFLKALGQNIQANEAKAASAGTTEVGCACLEAPDCDDICPYGGKPRGDGTQACECTPKTCEDPNDLAKVAKSGKWDDIVDKPSFNTIFPNVVQAGSAGPSANVTMSHSGTKGQSGSIVIPYFKVDSKGRITAYGNRTLKLSGDTYANYDNYANYTAYANYQAYANQTKYSNYNAYSNYYNYRDYYDQCCGDTDSDGD